jgi:hypothetical protein
MSYIVVGNNFYYCDSLSDVNYSWAEQSRIYIKGESAHTGTYYILTGGALVFLANQSDSKAIHEKQDTLVSGTNIKTINSQSLLGSGNIVISGASLADADYGDITVSGSGTVMTIDSVVATKVTEDSTHRFTTDSEKTTWNSKANGTHTHAQSDITNLTTDLAAKVTANVAIAGATKTKITYDTKGLVTSGADATTADIADSTNKRYVTDAQLTILGNTSSTNSGDETTATIKTKLGAAATGADGYLTSTDWNTFNNKVSYVVPDLNIDKLTVTANQNIPAGYGSVISRKYSINSGIKLTIGSGGRLRII